MANNPKAPGWGIEGYTSRALKQRSEKELRAEYTRLKSMLRKRGKAIARSAYGPEHPMAKRLMNLPSSKGLSIGQLRQALHEAGNLSLMKTSSVTGLDRAYKKSYEKIYGKAPSGNFSRKGSKPKKPKKRGGSARQKKKATAADLERQQLKDFGKWMEAFRAKFGEKASSLGSDIAQAAFQDIKAAGINTAIAIQHIEKWVELWYQADRQGKMLQDYIVQTSKGKPSSSSAAWRSAMGMGSKKGKAKKGKK